MSWSMYHFFGFNPYIWFACHWSVWCLLDYIQLTGVQVYSTDHTVTRQGQAQALTVSLCKSDHYYFQLY